MAAGTRHADFGPKAETDLYLMECDKWVKSDNYQHAADRLRSDGCVATDGNAEGCCRASDKHLSISH